MKIFEEEFLEPFLRRFRFNQAIKYIKKNKPLVLLDLGCGPKIPFYFFAKKNKVIFKKYIGVDPLINKNLIDKFVKEGNILILGKFLIKKIPLSSLSVDYIVAFAFLEHIENPENIFKEALRILKPGGKIILTTPTPKAKNILEFLSFKLKLVSPREIAEHKNYFTKEDLLSLIPKNKKLHLKIIHQYFEFGLNNLLVIIKK
jgi:SAM-dependent methyltransferase